MLRLNGAATTTSGLYRAARPLRLCLPPLPCLAVLPLLLLLLVAAKTVNHTDAIIAAAVVARGGHHRELNGCEQCVPLRPHGVQFRA